MDSRCKLVHEKMISLAAGEGSSPCKSRTCHWGAQIEHGAPHLEMGRGILQDGSLPLLSG